MPPGLRGHLTRWLLEISPGVFIGHISARVRELMWQRVIEYLCDGRALMVYTARNEQRLVFEVHGHDWEPIDHDGVCLMRRRTMPDYVLSHRSRRDVANRPVDPAMQASGFDSERVWKRRQARRKFKPKR
ncbi:hypothetical protein MBOT_39910 [Mycobacterium botniense]|uniref:Uncharacterized protein n=1 Tax=Mycobacterium botniense TaxID=84962 RepID=A0A7I9Y3H4_9MYCO|nr:hypothetical protein MBOT_39910 [Mycobacterium botniense]